MKLRTEFEAQLSDLEREIFRKSDTAYYIAYSEYLEERLENSSNNTSINDQKEISDDIFDKINYISNEYGNGFEKELFEDIVKLIESLKLYSGESGLVKVDDIIELCENEIFECKINGKGKPSPESIIQLLRDYNEGKKIIKSNSIKNS